MVHDPTIHMWFLSTEKSKSHVIALMRLSYLPTKITPLAISRLTNSDHRHDEECAVTILYATETGTAQEVADRIARQCRYAGFKCCIYNVEDYPSVRTSRAF